MPWLSWKLSDSIMRGRWLSFFILQSIHRSSTNTCARVQTMSSTSPTNLTLFQNFWAAAALTTRQLLTNQEQSRGEVQKHSVTKNKKRTEKITSKQASHAWLGPFGENIHIEGLHLNISLPQSNLPTFMWTAKRRWVRFRVLDWWSLESWVPKSSFYLLSTILSQWNPMVISTIMGDMNQFWFRYNADLWPLGVPGQLFVAYSILL